VNGEVRFRIANDSTPFAATSFMMQALFMLLSMLLSMWFLELVYPMLQSSLESTDDATISIPEPPPEVDEF
jgi:hypothetical protein